MDPTQLADQAVLLLTHGVVTLTRLVIESVIQRTVRALAETPDLSYQLVSILALVADRGTRDRAFVTKFDLASRIDALVRRLFKPESS